MGSRSLTTSTRRASIASASSRSRPRPPARSATWLGLRLGRAAHPTALDLYGAVISHARTVGEAVRLGLEHAPLWEQGPEMRVTAQDAGLSLAYINPPHPDSLANTIDSQESVVFLAALCHHLVAPGAARTQGHFACPRPPGGRHLNGLRALGCEPHFGGDEWRIDIPRVLLDRTLPPANPVVARLVRAHADEQLRSTVGADELPARLDLAIRRGLAQGQGVAQVAQVLGMSSRALQQALTARGTSFSAEQRRVRIELGHEMLARAEHSVAAVAGALGFSSLSSFSRFFRGATGSSPQAHRRRARPAQGQTSARNPDTSS